MEGGSIPGGGSIEIENSESLRREAYAILRELIQYNNLYESIISGGYYALSMMDNSAPAEYFDSKIKEYLAEQNKLAEENNYPVLKEKIKLYRDILKDSYKRVFSADDVNFLKEFRAEIDRFYKFLVQQGIGDQIIGRVEGGEEVFGSTHPHLYSK